MDTFIQTEKRGINTALITDWFFSEGEELIVNFSGEKPLVLEGDEAKVVYSYLESLSKKLRLFLVNSNSFVGFYYSFKTQEQIKIEIEKTGDVVYAITLENEETLKTFPHYDCRFI